MAAGGEDEGEELPRFPEGRANVALMCGLNGRFLDLPLHEALVEGDELGVKSHKKKHLSEV